MGGPIVRSYGVPNWDDIFGSKSDEKKAPKAAKKKGAVKKEAPVAKAKGKKKK